MSDAIKVLHFADVHIGMENYGGIDRETGLNSRLRDFLDRMDEMIAFAADHAVDLTIFAGDAFKTRTPNPTHQREFALRLRRLSALAPVVLLVGNHDLPTTLIKATSVEIFRVLEVPGIWVADEYDLRRIDTASGAVVVAAAPYPLRARVLEGVNTGGKTIAETDSLLARELDALLDSLAERADAYGDLPRILTGHFTVSGAMLGSERAIMLGRDVQVPPAAVADPRWDYVALGHIHKHQNLTGGRQGIPPVVYSGSLERIDFGEEGDVKGFCWIDLRRGATTWTFEPVSARPFVTISADLRTSDDPTGDLVALIDRRDLQGAIVRVLLDLTRESDARLQMGIVRDALQRRGAVFVAGIRRTIDEPARARLGASPEGLSDEELLDRYLISRDVSPERRTLLRDAAARLLSAAADADSA